MVGIPQRKGHKPRDARGLKEAGKSRVTEKGESLQREPAPGDSLKLAWFTDLREDRSGCLNATVKANTPRE